MPGAGTPTHENIGSTGLIQTLFPAKAGIQGCSSFPDPGSGPGSQRKANALKTVFDSIFVLTKWRAE